MGHTNGSVVILADRVPNPDRRIGKVYFSVQFSLFCFLGNFEECQ